MGQPYPFFKIQFANIQFLFGLSFVYTVTFTYGRCAHHCLPGLLSKILTVSFDIICELIVVNVVDVILISWYAAIHQYVFYALQPLIFIVT